MELTRGLNQQDLSIGKEIEAIVTAPDSNYVRVIGTITDVRNGMVNIKATKVVSKWSEDGKFKDHPTSCAMSVRPENIVNK